MLKITAKPVKKNNTTKVRVDFDGDLDEYLNAADAVFEAVIKGIVEFATDSPYDIFKLRDVFIKSATEYFSKHIHETLEGGTTNANSVKGLEK